MNGTTLSVCLPGATADQLVTAGRLAETWSLNVWVGDPTGGADNSDDTYVTTAAAALAAATSHVRLGLILTLRGSATPLRVAEDIGVVDQASGGRVEVGLVVPDDDIAGWEKRARSMLDAWHTWPAGSERTVAATPRPAQPWMPRLVLGRGAIGDLADRLRAGTMVSLGETPEPTNPDYIQRRTVLLLAGAIPDAGVTGWCSPDPWTRMREVRAEVDRHQAHEVLACLPNTDPARLASDMKTLGVVVGPAIRCSSHQAELLTHDAWNWLTELQHLHTSPEEWRLASATPEGASFV